MQLPTHLKLILVGFEILAYLIWVKLIIDLVCAISASATRGISLYCHADQENGKNDNNYTLNFKQFI